MNNEEFLKCRKISDRLNQEKSDLEEKRENRLLEIETRISMLEEDAMVQEYINLRNEKENINNDKMFSRLTGMTSDQIAYQAFDYACKKTQDSNKIYVFMGYANTITGVYRDLETLENLNVNIKDEYQFSKTNKIIFSTIDDKEYFFSLLRVNFLKYLTNNSQEQSVEKILKLSKRLFNSNN